MYFHYDLTQNDTDNLSRIFKKNKYYQDTLEKQLVFSKIKNFSEKFENYLVMFTTHYLGYKGEMAENYVRLYQRIIDQLHYGELLKAKKLLSRISHPLIKREDKVKLMRYIWKFEESLIQKKKK